jgi:protein-L-isoaspartate O-methyltransferase
MAKPCSVNIHYDRKLDACAPARAASVLEVGCGDGFLAARLSQRVPRVIAADIASRFWRE